MERMSQGRRGSARGARSQPNATRAKLDVRSTRRPPLWSGSRRSAHSLAQRQADLEPVLACGTRSRRGGGTRRSAALPDPAALEHAGRRPRGRVPRQRCHRQSPTSAPRPRPRRARPLPTASGRARPGASRREWRKRQADAEQRLALSRRAAEAAGRRARGAWSGNPPSSTRRSAISSRRTTRARSRIGEAVARRAGGRRSGCRRRAGRQRGQRALRRHSRTPRRGGRARRSPAGAQRRVRPGQRRQVRMRSAAAAREARL